MKKSSGRKILAIGHLPPPVNGLTFITSRLVRSLANAGYEISFVNTGVLTETRSSFFHACRLAKTLRGLFWIAWNGISGASRVCYFTAEGGLGLIYTVMLAGCARLFCSRIYIHHHSYSYITRPNKLMQLIMALSSDKAVHICLCSKMAQSLASQYGRRIQSLILSNAAFVDPESSGPPVFLQRQFLVIGLLSNLTADKGLHEFLDIVRLASRRRLPIRAILAGPVKLEEDRVLLDETRRVVGEYLEYRGPVYGEEKLRFFADIDLFVFLTTYLNEAQPTVIFEAMSNGVPVISYDRGCISGQVADGGFVYSQEADVVTDTVNLMVRYRSQPNWLAEQKRAALEHFKNERQLGQDLVNNLFDASPMSFDDGGKLVEKVC